MLGRELRKPVEVGAGADRLGHHGADAGDDVEVDTDGAASGTTMSEKKIAASTPCLRTGWRVISATSSGRRQDSSMGMPSRTRRYSGSDRPACRMNHTGVWLTGCWRAARTRLLSSRTWGRSPQESRTRGVSAPNTRRMPRGSAAEWAAPVDGAAVRPR